MRAPGPPLLVRRLDDSSRNGARMFTPDVLLGVAIGVAIVALGTFLGVRGHLRKQREDDII